MIPVASSSGSRRHGAREANKSAPSMIGGQQTKNEHEDVTKGMLLRTGAQKAA